MDEESKEIAVEQPKKKVALISGGEIRPIIPGTYEEAWRMAQAFSFAGIVPKGLEGKSPEETLGKVTTAIMHGLEVGLPPISAVRNIMVVNGRPQIWGDGAIALVHASGKLEWMKEEMTEKPKSPEWTATCTMKRKGQESPYTHSFTFGQATAARLNTRPIWLAYPEIMLMNRARAFCIRKGFADCLSGLAIAEEVGDFEEEVQKVEAGFLEE